LAYIFVHQEINFNEIESIGIVACNFYENFFINKKML